MDERLVFLVSRIEYVAIYQVQELFLLPGLGNNQRDRLSLDFCQVLLQQIVVGQVGRNQKIVGNLVGGIILPDKGLHDFRLAVEGKLLFAGDLSFFHAEELDVHFFTGIDKMQDILIVRPVHGNFLPLRELLQRAHLVAAYFQVSGPISDPTVVPKPITSAAAFFKKFFSIPVNVVRPKTIK